METQDITIENVNRYGGVRRHTLFRCERLIFDRVLRSEMLVLDLGCGNGRATGYLLHNGIKVLACDLNVQALYDLSLSFSDCISINIADARDLPVLDCTLDAVIFAWNGIDMIYPEQERIRALEEIDRVLKPGGYFIFSSHNPTGLLLSPWGIWSWRSWLFRLRHLWSGNFKGQYSKDSSGLLLYQDKPCRIINQVHAQTHMKFRFALDRTGTIYNLLLLTLFSQWPHYVFEKKL